MPSPARLLATLAGATALGGLAPTQLAARQQPAGYAVESAVVVDRCSRCHRVDEDGRMSRISYLRKTPEGWQTSIRRMVSLHGARLNAEDARAIVRYLADEQGLAPDELRPGRFEVERRMIDYDYPGDSGVEYTCIQCHSMGRVITQRRTEEEWGLLIATHRSLYPLVDFQAFLRSGPPPEEGDARQPMDAAIDHLSETFPLETPEWSAWAPTERSPRLEGEWALSGYERGQGPLYGRMTIERSPDDPEAFITRATYVYPESGRQVSRSGDALVYTGYQWRGRSNPGADSELREVMMVERNQQEMSGRWFSGAYDEIGPDVRLTRVRGPVLAGIYPTAVRAGTTTEVTLFGAGLPDAITAGTLDFGDGVTVQSVEASGADVVGLTLSVAPGARVGARDVFALGTVLERGVVVHDGVDRIEVTPATGLARVGGANFPKGFETFEAIAWNDGPDGDANTDDDLDLGRVDASWTLQEYAAVYDDDDIDYVGAMDPDGTFVPALDGPNPERSRNRDNVGDVWVVGAHRTQDGRELTARAHLIVTVPLYIRFEPWRELDPRRRLGSGM